MRKIFATTGLALGMVIAASAYQPANALVPPECVEVTSEKAENAIKGARAAAVNIIKQADPFDKLSCLDRLMNSGLGFMFSPPSLGDIMDQIMNMACDYAETKFAEVTAPLNQSLYAGMGDIGVGGLNLGNLGMEASVGVVNGSSPGRGAESVGGAGPVQIYTNTSSVAGDLKEDFKSSTTYKVFQYLKNKTASQGE